MVHLATLTTGLANSGLELAAGLSRFASGAEVVAGGVAGPLLAGVSEDSCATPKFLPLPQHLNPIVGNPRDPLALGVLRAPVLPPTSSVVSPLTRKNSAAWQALSEVFQKNPIEHSLFVYASGGYNIVSGDEGQTASVHEAGGYFLAHTHAHEADFSLADAQILVGRLLLNPGEVVEHTILGHADDGASEWQRVRLKIENGVLKVEVFGSGKLPTARQDVTRELFDDVYTQGCELDFATWEIWSKQSARARVGLDLPAGLSSDISRDEFLRVLGTVDWQSYFAKLPSVQDLAEGATTVFTLSGKLLSNIRSLSLNLGEEKKSRSIYFQLRFEIQRKASGFAVIIRDCVGMNSKTIAAALRDNPHVIVPTWFYTAVGRGVTRAVRPLLLRLSEFGRRMLLHKMRVMGMELEDGAVAATSENVSLAALQLLLDLARDFVASPTWSPFDPRFGLATTLNSFFLAEHRFSHAAEALLVSNLVMAAMVRVREHELSDYRRLLREAGDSPIAESGWDFVFSPELRAYLLEVAKNDFHLDVGDANISHEMLKNPFNEVVGAAYFRLAYEEDNVFLSQEILLHAWHQRRRHDALTWFYDGFQRVSLWDRDRVTAVLNLDIENVTALFKEWDLDRESPFRLVNGLNAAATKFLWHEVFDKKTRSDLVKIAREVFVQHADDFTDDIDLAEKLPQALFMEIVGVAAARSFTEWQKDKTVDTALGLLDLYLGLGSDSVLGFMRGYETERPYKNARQEMRTVTEWLVDKKDEEEKIRKYLEEIFTYERNVVENEHYTREPVSVRRGELVEAALTGLGFQKLTGELRNFRLSGLTAEQEVNLFQDALAQINGDTLLDSNMAQRLFVILNLYTAPPRRRRGDEFDSGRWLNPKPGDRWHLLTTWYSERVEEFKKILEAVLPEKPKRR